MMDNVLEQIAHQIPVQQEPGDYVEDGLLYCGRCHTKKQVKVEIPWRGTSRVFSCMCQCQSARAEQEQNDFMQTQQFRHKQQQLPQGVPAAVLKQCHFSAADGSNEKAMTILQRYVQKFEQVQQKCLGLLLWGPASSGKTFAAACVTNGLLAQRHTVLMTSFSRLVQELNNYKIDSNQYLRYLLSYDLLIIDDLALLRLADPLLEKFYQVIDERNKIGRPVVITTTVTPENLVQTTGNWKRICNRLHTMCVPLQFQEENRRITMHQHKLEWAKKELL